MADKVPKVDIPLISRTKLQPAQVEEADVNLSLGDFENVPTLSHSETKFLIETVMEQRRAALGGRRPEETEIMSKTVDWLIVFARFKHREAIMSVDRLLNTFEPQLAKFERSQLATLCPTDADEAFTLIPSMKGKVESASVDALMKNIANLRTFE